MRAPDIEVMAILIRLTDYFNKLAELNGDEPFIEDMIKEALYNDSVSGDGIIELMQQDLGKGQYNAPYALIITCAYAGQTIRAAMSNNTEAAHFAADTKYWFGIVTGHQDSGVMSWRAMCGNQKEKAKKLRPKKKPTLKSLVMDEMLKWRNKDHTFDEFMNAGKNESIDWLFMESIAGDKFNLSWGDLGGKKSKKTLKDWWGDCTKENITK